MSTEVLHTVSSFTITHEWKYAAIRYAYNFISRYGK